MGRHKVASINIRRRYLEGKRRRKRRARRRGFPHSNEPEISMKVELWVGVTPSGRNPVIWIPMKRILRALKPREEGLIKDVKPNETRTPSNRFLAMMSRSTCLARLLRGD